jgi:hypothetical protein
MTLEDQRFFLLRGVWGSLQQPSGGRGSLYGSIAYKRGALHRYYHNRGLRIGHKRASTSRKMSPAEFTKELSKNHPREGKFSLTSIISCP